MLRWLLSFVVLAGGAYYFMQYWPSAQVKWDGMVPHWNDPPGHTLGTPGPTAQSPWTVPLPWEEWWRDETVMGLKLRVPFGLDKYDPPTANKKPGTESIEYYRGKGGHRFMYLAHVPNSRLGDATRAWYGVPLYNSPDTAGMKVLSVANTTTVVNGLRAQRRDRISANAVPRLHARDLVLQRGSEVWLLEFYAPESDTSAERIFQRIAWSAQAM